MGTVKINSSSKESVIAILLEKAREYWEEGLDPSDENSMTDVVAALWRQALVSSLELPRRFESLESDEDAEYYSDEREEHIRLSNVIRREARDSAICGNMFLYLLRRHDEGGRAWWVVEFVAPTLHTSYETCRGKGAELRFNLLLDVMDDLAAWGER